MIQNNHQIQAQQTVSAFIDALNKEDFDAACIYVQSDMVFIGVLGTREGADAYFNDMKKMKLKYSVKQIIAGDSDVSVLYDIDMGNVTILASGWYHIIDGKIKTMRVIFDPRPVLAK